MGGFGPVEQVKKIGSDKNIGVDVISKDAEHLLF